MALSTDRAGSPDVEGLTAAAEMLKDSVTDPITLALIVDPVVAEDGWTYEREAIDLWLRGKDTAKSPSPWARGC